MQLRFECVQTVRHCHNVQGSGSAAQAAALTGGAADHRQKKLTASHLGAIVELQVVNHVRG